MATQSTSSKSKTQAKRATTEAKKSAAASASATKRAAAAEKNQAQAAVETAVDLPVGAVLTVRDRLSDLVDPWTDRGSAEKQIKSYRTQLRRTIKRTERRGTTARRKVATEARRTRTRAERRVRHAIDQERSRAQNLVDQISSLR